MKESDDGHDVVVRRIALSLRINYAKVRELK